MSNIELVVLIFIGNLIAIFIGKLIAALAFRDKAKNSMEDDE